MPSKDHSAVVTDTTETPAKRHIVLYRSPQQTRPGIEPPDLSRITYRKAIKMAAMATARNAAGANQPM